MLIRLERILLFLTVLFLPTQLGKHFWPDFSYIYSLKVDYLSPTIYFWDLLVVGLLTVWILQKPWLNKIALNLLLLFLFTQALSLLGSANIGAGFVRLEQYTLAGIFGVYLASSKFTPRLLRLHSIRVRSGQEVQSSKLFWPLGLAVLGESVLAIAQFIKGETLGFWILGERTFNLSTPGIAKFDFYGYEFLRPYATFPHPNALAAFMLLSIVILNKYLCHSERLVKNLSTSLETGLPLSWKILRRGLLRMTINKISVFLAGLTIFLTMSRTVILAGFIMLIISLRKRWIMVITIIIVILSPILFVRFSAIFNFDNLTLLRRGELSVSALRMFLEFPIFGVGLNNFIPSLANQLVSGPSRFLQPVHNIFLLVLAETGILGLLGVLVLIGYPIKKIFNFQFSIFKLMPWAVIIFLGMFDHYFLTLPQGYRLLFLVWGLTFPMQYK